MSGDSIEREIQEKGLTAPRVTPADIEASIVGEHYFTAEQAVRKTEPDDYRYHMSKESLSLLTFCVLILRNGFTVTGESACASPEIFDAEIGRKIAREKAKEKIWVLEGYLLKEKLSK